MGSSSFGITLILMIIIEKYFLHGNLIVGWLVLSLFLSNVIILRRFRYLEIGKSLQIMCVILPLFILYTTLSPLYVISILLTHLVIILTTAYTADEVHKLYKRNI